MMITMVLLWLLVMIVLYREVRKSIKILKQLNKEFGDE